MKINNVNLNDKHLENLIIASKNAEGKTMEKNETIRKIIQKSIHQSFSIQNETTETFFNAFIKFKNINMEELKKQVLIKRYPDKNEFLFDNKIIFQDKFVFPGYEIVNIDNSTTYYYEHRSFVKEITFHEGKYYLKKNEYMNAAGEHKDFENFKKAIMKNLCEHHEIPVDILKSKLSPEYINGRTKMIDLPRPSIDPRKEAAAKNVMDDTFHLTEKQHETIIMKSRQGGWTNQIFRNLDEKYKELNPGINFEELYFQQIQVSAELFTDNINFQSECKSLKKLFFEEHKEKIELNKIIDMYKSREKNLLERCEGLLND